MRILTLLLLLVSAQTLPAGEKLNILLFTADDLHSESVGAFALKPSDLTPHLDRFASQSMRFDRAHVNVGICAPSRAVIGTGLYSHRSGAMGFFKARDGVPDLVTTLQQSGYLAGILGKVDHSTPTRQMKWDYSFDRKDLGDGRHPGVYAARSRTFFERAKKETKPFYFMVNSHDPHRPYCNPEKIRRGAAKPSKIYSPGEVVVPGFVPDLPGVREELSHYYNSTRRLDDTFAAVMKELQVAGFEKNTVVLFISDNGIAIPFAKCNAWLHSTRTPLLVRWPGTVKPKSVDATNFVSGIDFFPTFLEITGVKGPKELDGRSFVPLLKGESQSGRHQVFTQIDKKAGHDAVPMRCVQNAEYGYIYNPFADGEHRYRNNNEGKSMKAMVEAAQTDRSIAERIQLFRYRVPEELYDLKSDPNCLKNLIDDPKHAAAKSALKKELRRWMTETRDPMLPAFDAMHDRKVVDKVMEDTYGPPVWKKKQQKKNKQPKRRRNQNKKNGRKQKRQAGSAK
ncbi:MAG: sulfatase [Planctomycetota bacterium]